MAEKQEKSEEYYCAHITSLCTVDVKCLYLSNVDDDYTDYRHKLVWN